MTNMLSQLKLSVDDFMGSEAEVLNKFNGQFDKDDFGFWDIFEHVETAVREKSRMAYEISMPKFIQGKGAAADAIRTMATNKIGLEPSEDPKKDFQKEASGSTSRTSR